MAVEESIQPRKMSEETKSKISEAIKQKNEDPAYRKEVADKRREAGYEVRTEEQRIAMRAGTSASWTDPDKLRKRVQTMLSKLATVLALDLVIAKRENGTLIEL